MVDKNSVWPLLETYDSYDDYVRIMTPLMLMELWESVSIKYKACLATVLSAAVSTRVSTHSDDIGNNHIVTSSLSSTGYTSSAYQPVRKL